MFVQLFTALKIAYFCGLLIRRYAIRAVFRYYSRVQRVLIHETLYAPHKAIAEPRAHMLRVVKKCYLGVKKFFQPFTEKYLTEKFTKNSLDIPGPYLVHYLEPPIRCFTTQSQK